MNKIFHFHQIILLENIRFFKEESEKHKISSLRFLSFFREISCELSLDPKYRSAPMDYITLKRFEFDKVTNDLVKLYLKYNKLIKSHIKL